MSKGLTGIADSDIDILAEFLPDVLHRLIHLLAVGCVALECLDRNRELLGKVLCKL